MMNKSKMNQILIIDDETANIIALSDILSSEYDVYVAKNGKNAIELVKEYMPDLILLDVLMPEMDGYEVIGELKSSETTRSIPVIFITGLDNIDAEKKGLVLGASDYIPKPFTPDIVKLRVQNQLKIVNHARELNEQLIQQALITKISRSFLNDAPIDLLYTDTLRMVGEFMNVTQVLLYKYEADDNMLVCQNEWIKPDLNIEKYIGERFELKEQMLSTINNLLKNDNGVFSFKSNNLTAPIFIKGKLYALLDFSEAENDREWSESEINLVVLVSSIFSGVFEREAMERQFSLVENSPNFILYISADTVVEYVNPAVFAVTGYTQNELVKEGIGVIFDEKTMKDIKEKHMPNAMRGEAAGFEISINRKDGEKRILRVSVVKTEKNNFGIIAGDLTEIRELEAGLKVAKEQAESSREHAEHSSRVKGEFLSRMSHEMRTPLNAIIGMMQVIKMRGVPEGMDNYFNAIDDYSGHLLELVDDVLDVSNMEYGMSKLFNASFNIKEMLRDISASIKHKTSLKEQIFNSSIDHALPESLIGDEKRLKQIITNLLANAVKYTPEKGNISLDAHMSHNGYGWVTIQIEVTDNGIGISEEQQKGLFTIFEQVDGSRTRKHGGIGIGLALSKRIALMMGGDIWVESKPDKGSKFTFICKFRRG